MTTAAIEELRAESARNEADALRRLARHEWELVARERDAWSPMRAPCDADAARRALQCALGVGETREHAAELEALAAAHGPDGGLARRPEADGALQMSARCGALFLRANEVLRSATLAGAARRAIDFALETPAAAGRSVDPGRRDLEATSAALALWSSAVALGEAHRRDEVARSRRAALGSLLAARADGDGCTGSERDPSGAAVTAHLIEDALAPAVLLEGGGEAAEACADGLLHLARQQAPSGSWGDDVARTMDCVRAAMLALRALAAGAPRALAALGASADLRWVEGGMAWILAVKADQGWGDALGESPSLARTCDGLDTLVKYGAFRRGDTAPLARLWGYAR